MTTWIRFNQDFSICNSFYVHCCRIFTINVSVHVLNKILLEKNSLVGLQSLGGHRNITDRATLDVTSFIYVNFDWAAPSLSLFGVES